MSSFSLKRRLLLGSVVAIVMATILAGIGIDAISGLAIRALALSEIDDEMRLLLASIEITPSNDLSIEDGPQDPRFGLPNGGFYWQVGRGGTVELRSQSLWDQKLPWLHAAPRELGRAHGIAGPNGADLLAVERSIVISTAAGDQSVTALIALDNSELAPARWRFFYAMAPSLAVLMLALIGAVVAVLRYGLRPLDELRVALAAVRERAVRLIGGQFPSEIQPLVDDLNELIASRETQLMQARARAGDLAHGLKTPLAVLEATARNLAESGQPVAAAAIREEVRRVDVQVRRTLAQARASLAAAQMSASVEAVPVLTRIVAAMQRLARDKPVAFALEAPQELRIGMDESDFTNVVGNLLDNARKWAATQAVVRLALVPASREIVLSIEDDGPGLPEDVEHTFIERGKRLDETVTGTGFGLAIAKDIVEAYGGELGLAAADLGGLKVSVRLPGRLAIPAASPAAPAPVSAAAPQAR
ncbi:sensor histidine kinase [Labrys wisconsinensis]|uniref:histidine kinase n=1 Tax=Labrys wisconsinensis TaxID=425677 RepID=A0ABU0J4A0_9HYPH|nr:sensor histidine kinase [Labrys wisconsinensis]MDQ0469102.1 signal transduction histidine kinase [Labrys wisconsinensis]